MIILVIILIIAFSLFIEVNSNKNKEDNMVLKLIYTFLIGIFLAVFVGVGIAAFYPGPKRPETPPSIKYAFPDNKEAISAESKAEIEKYDLAEKEYQLQSQTYNKNVSIYSLTAAILIVITSLTLFKNILFIADGLLLGGVLTLLYSVIRGFDAQDNMFRFIVVSIGLFISLFLGYTKFVQPVKK